MRQVQILPDKLNPQYKVVTLMRTGGDFLLIANKLIVNGQKLHNKEIDGIIKNVLVNCSIKQLYMKVKLFSNYDSSVNLIDRFKSNYLIDDDMLTFVTNNIYDFAVVFNGTTEPLNAQKKIITVIQEPSWSPLVRNLTFIQNSDFVIIHDPKLFENNYNIRLKGKVIQSPSFMFYNDRIDHNFYQKINNISNRKKLSIIMSNANYGVANYADRLQVLRQILDSDLNIDIYGKDLGLTDNRYCGKVNYKYQALIPYEYSIAIENSNEYNYISEKFFDCVLCNTIPIYNGAPNIAEVYDPRYFRLIDIHSTTIIDDIKQIIKEPAPISTTNKEIYFNKFNLYKMLKHIIFEMT